MKTSADMQTARTMWTLGATYDEIAVEVGVNRDTAATWIHEAQRRKHVERNRRWRARQAKAREKERLVDAMVCMRRGGGSWPAIALAVKAFSGREISHYTARKWVSDADPDFPRKPRGLPFGQKTPVRCSNPGSAALENEPLAGTIA